MKSPHPYVNPWRLTLVALACGAVAWAMVIAVIAWIWRMSHG